MSRFQYLDTCAFEGSSADSVEYCYSSTQLYGVNPHAPLEGDPSLHLSLGSALCVSKKNNAYQVCTPRSLKPRVTLLPPCGAGQLPRHDAPAGQLGVLRVPSHQGLLLPAAVRSLCSECLHPSLRPPLTLSRRPAATRTGIRTTPCLCSSTSRGASPATAPVSSKMDDDG